MGDRPESWPASVSTTMEPDKQIEVTEQEWTDLSRQGLLHDDGTKIDKPRAAKAVRDGEDK